MAVDFVQTWNWGLFDNPGAFQPNYLRVPFSGAPHIVGSAYLAEVSIGELNATAGVAVASFKRFEFLDGSGVVQETEITSVTSFIEVENCVSITLALDTTAASALGGWTFYSGAAMWERCLKL